MTDAVANVITLLFTNWTKANTDDIKPLFLDITTIKQTDVLNNDYVLVYEVDLDDSSFGIGGKDFATEVIITADIRTTFLKKDMELARGHAIKMRDEIRRIVRAKIENPDSDFKLIQVRRIKDLSNKNIGIGRFAVDLVLQQWGEPP